MLCAIRPQAGWPSPSPDNPVATQLRRSLTSEATNCVQPQARIKLGVLLFVDSRPVVIKYCCRSSLRRVPINPDLQASMSPSLRKRPNCCAPAKLRDGPQAYVRHDYSITSSAIAPWRSDCKQMKHQTARIADLTALVKVNRRVLLA